MPSFSMFAVSQSLGPNCGQDRAKGSSPQGFAVHMGRILLCSIFELSYFLPWRFRDKEMGLEREGGGGNSGWRGGCTLMGPACRGGFGL